MTMFFDPAVFGNLSAVLLFVLLGGLLLVQWRGQQVSGVLILASMASAVMFCLQALAPQDSGLWAFLLKLLEIVRNTAWLGFLYVVTGRHLSGLPTSGRRWLLVAVSGLPLLLTGLLLYPLFSGTPYAPMLVGVNLEHILFIGNALLGLHLLEQLFRGMSPAGRWAVKFICFGLGGIFVYDLFLYSNAVLFRTIDGDLVAARGLVNAMCVPLIAMAVVRLREWDMTLFISRHVIFHSTAVLVAGIYLVIMAAAGYYIRNFGGEWGGTLHIAFLFGAILLLLVMFFSTDLRANLRVFLVKHFYKNKYDYREEWLGFARTLAECKENTEYYRTMIKAVTDVVKSPGGALWLRDSEGHFSLVEKNGIHDRLDTEIPGQEPFVRFMESRRWILNVDECRSSPEKQEEPALPQWIIESTMLWVIVPLFNANTFNGFMILARPHGNPTFDWEDRDLLKTVGYQTAAYIALLRTSDALSEARQFETFNRLSAFMVHDIKNIMAQLTFISSNYPKYRDNQEFINDAVETITHATEKMKKLLGYLGRGQIVAAPILQKIDPDVLIRSVIARRAIARPEPQLRQTMTGLVIHAEMDKLASALEHLIQNAQEATNESGNVWLTLEYRDSQAMIRISDDGCGMDEEFMRTRLYRPFDTTKGNAGMGIGVYESREIIREIGGSMKVESRPGQGTVFTLALPCTLDSAVN